LKKLRQEGLRKGEFLKKESGAGRLCEVPKDEGKRLRKEKEAELDTTKKG